MPGTGDALPVIGTRRFRSRAQLRARWPGAGRAEQSETVLRGEVLVVGQVQQRKHVGLIQPGQYAQHIHRGPALAGWPLLVFTQPAPGQGRPPLRVGAQLCGVRVESRRRAIQRPPVSQPVCLTRADPVPALYLSSDLRVPQAQAAHAFAQVL